MSQFIVQHSTTGWEFVVSLGEPPVILVVAPTSIADDDDRAIKVLATSDTITGEVTHQVMMPEATEEEREMWAAGVSVASLVAATYDDLMQIGVMSDAE